MWLRGALNGVLIGNWKTLETQFAIQRDGPSDAWRVVLTPREGDLRLAIEAVVITGSQFAERVEVRRGGGDIDRLMFFNQAVAADPLSEEESALFASAFQ